MNLLAMLGGCQEQVKVRFGSGCIHGIKNNIKINAFLRIEK